MLPEQNFNRQLRINAIIKGLILGVILLASSIFSYYLITQFTTTPWIIVTGPYFCAIIFPLIITIIFCIDMRRRLGGYWEFKQAVTAIFIMFLTCYVLLTIGRDIIFFRYVEPDMMQKTAAVMLKVRIESLKMGGASQAEINSQIVELRKEFELERSLDVGELIQSFVINLIMLFLLAVIFGAIYKKPPPYTLQVNTDIVEL